MKLICGCGYLGRRVARRWLEQSEPVYAITRSGERADELARDGLRPIVADVTDPVSLPELPPIRTVLYAIALDRASGQSFEQVYVEGLRNVLQRLPDSVQRFLYVSSTGVYGQIEGEWVEEDAPVEPAREAGRAIVAAERLLMQHPLGQRSVILRMAGLYGPGRIPRRRELEAGQPVAAAAEGMLNLIHIDDAAALVLQAEQHAPVPRVYNVADGHPVERREFYRELARQLGLGEPAFRAPDPGTSAALRASSDKRISTRRLRAELPVQLRYPSYREGLKAILKAEPR